MDGQLLLQDGESASDDACNGRSAQSEGDFAPTLRNYEEVFNNEAFLRAIVNSAIVAISVTLLALAVGAFAGFALGKLRYRGKKPRSI